MAEVAASLRALLTNLIDYAGLYPPACLPLPQVVDRFKRYAESQEGWILNRLVLPAAKLNEVSLEQQLRISLLVESAPGLLPPNVETVETKLTYKLALPTYCEAPLSQIKDAFAKFRTGGVTADAIPSTEAVAVFLCQAAERDIPFMATAGLHHPLRSLRPLTYDEASPRATMHGFLNLFTAAAFAWYGAGRDVVVAVLDTTEAKAFEFFDGEMRWQGQPLSTGQLRRCRQHFAHSFGSCSFEEPVSDLRDLGLL